MNAYAAFLTLVAVASAPAPGHSPEQKLWMYACNVLLPNLCFRLPSGASVTYEVPADFGVYTVKEPRSTGLVTIYSGPALDKSRLSETPSIKINSSSHSLYGFISMPGQTKGIDILITAK